MKVQIDLPPDVYQKLKQEASAHFQSLRGHIAYRLINQVRDTNNNVIDLSTLPEGTTIRTTTPVKHLPRRPRRDLIKEAEEGDFFPSGIRVHSCDDNPFTDEEYRYELEQLFPDVRNHPDFITLKNYYDDFNSTEEERSEARERLIGLRHSKELVSHETLYLEQAFDFTPPGDEPTLDLATYISNLLQGGWYDDTTVCLTPKKID